jgi:lipopolysaccharide export system protein LptC
MSLPRWVPIALLALLAATSSWLVWQLRKEHEPPPLYGPPRSDYVLLQYELTALDDNGKESFRVSGPALARHPHLGTLNLEEPRFLFPDSEGKPWNARAGSAWVAKDGSEVRLSTAVEFDGPPNDAGQRIEVRTAELSVLPKQNQVNSAAAVTLTGPGSILRGRGLHADLDARRFQLSQVKGEYAPSSR